jgi:hypothetical protein
MENLIVYSSAIINGFILLYFTIRGVIFINKFGFNDISASKKPIRRTSIYLSTLFVLSFFVVLNELVNSFKDPGNLQLGLIGIYTLAFASTAYVLNKLLFTNTINSILYRELPSFKLDEKNNPDAKKDFEKICRFFKNEFNLFEESIDQLLDLINPDSESPIIFNIKKDCGDGQRIGLTNRTLLFLFYRMLKEKCIKTRNSSIVLLTRFRQDGKPLTEPEKSLKNQRHSLASEINRAITSIPEKELRPILHRMKEYHIQFSKTAKNLHRKEASEKR